MGKIISFYLKRMLANSQHQEQSLEVNADLIDNVNEKWKKQRERSDTLKAVIKMLWTKTLIVWNENKKEVFFMSKILSLYMFNPNIYNNYIFNI